MDLTNEQWERIAAFIPGPKARPGQSGRPPQDARSVLSGILWILRSGQKRGAGVGKTKRGKGTKIMGLADAEGLPLAIDAGSASPHEVTLVEATLDASFLEDLPERVIGDKAYDSDSLDRRLEDERGVEMIAPHRGNRSRPPSQDGRRLQRYKRRWKIERLFAWLQNFRRLVVRYEYHLHNFLAMAKLGCIILLLRRVLG